MAPLKGTTLGEKHKYYNQLLKEALAKGPTDLQKINYEYDDIDNMLRIDIACNERNVQYILEVFKCDDMLYVSRAIKHSVWLITEQEYAHLINPEYLHSNLFPQMTSKAITKLMLHIRRNLKDEERAQTFFSWVDKNNPDKALKWLEYCSLDFKNEIVAKNPNRISPALLKRLCNTTWHSSDGNYIYRSYVENYDYSYRNNNFYIPMFLLNHDTEYFLYILRLIPSWGLRVPSFNKKETEIMMGHCFYGIIKEFRIYRSHIHLPTFVKYINKNRVNIENFLLTKCKGRWLSFDNLKPFLVKLPQDGNVKLLTKLFATIDGTEVSDSDVDRNDDVSDTDDDNTDSITNHSDAEHTEEVEDLFFRIEFNNKTFSNVYRWYEFVPFEKAFQDLQKFIYAESSPDERHLMLIVLLKSAKKNMELVRKVLQYYHDKHINESYIQKIKFVNSLLAMHDAFNFDDTTWNILNELFHSLEVYIESTNKVQSCVDTIILRKICKATTYPINVDQKFSFRTFKELFRKLHYSKQDDLLTYLSDQIDAKLCALDLNTDSGRKQTVELIKDILTLIKDWKLKSYHHRFDIDKIISESNLYGLLSEDIEIRSLLRSVKPYYRLLFENSLLLYPCENACIRALKHDPALLIRYKNEVKALNNKEPLKNFLSKLRIYWQDSLAIEWTKTLIKNLHSMKKQETSVKGFFVLSSQTSLIDFLKKYAPKDNKIKWRTSNQVEVSLQKNIAKNMHLIRPQLPTEVVLLYAKKDYLKYTLFSINSIYLNMRSKDIQRHIYMLLTAPVSLQKHGIRLACAMMKTEELLDTFTSIWKSIDNLSIRNILFQKVFGFLSKAEDALVEDIWRVFRFMINDLNHEENKEIYTTLAKVNQVPVSIIQEYYKISYLFLKELPKINSLENLIKGVLEYATDVIQYLDSNFVENTLLVSVYDIFSSKNRTLTRILTAYLLRSTDEINQLQKYNNLFIPLFELCVQKWKKKEYESKVIESFQDFLENTLTDLPRFVFQMKMVMPVAILESICNILESELCYNEFYDVITRWKLSAAYIKLLNNMIIKKPDKFNDWAEIISKSTKTFSNICVRYVKEDIKSHFPSVYILFANVMKRTCEDFGITGSNFLKILDGMLIYKDVPIYTLVLKMLPEKRKNNEFENKKIDAICRQIYNFPSKELKMHYYNKYSKKYTSDCESEYEESDRETESDSDDDEDSKSDSDDKEDSLSDSNDAKSDSEDEGVSGNDSDSRFETCESEEGSDVSDTTEEFDRPS